VASIAIAAVIRDDGPVLNAKNIAERYWQLYEQDKDTWEFNVRMGDIQDLLKFLEGQ
jgi:hypothetical protein